MPVRAVIFDHDGTLVDSYEGIAACMRLTCRDLGVAEMDEGEIRASIGPTLESRFAELWGEEVAGRAVVIYRRHYEDHFLSGTRLLPGVRETLAAIQARGIPMACVTNKTWFYCERQLAQFGLLEKMRAVFGNRQGLPPKPDPAMVHAALGRLGVKAAEAVLVGDTPIDVATARAAGVGAWAVRGRYASPEEMERSRPDRHFNHLGDILEFL